MRMARSVRAHPVECAMRVRDVMTAPVATCRVTAPVGEAANVMRQQCVGWVPVVDRRGRLAGLLAARDGGLSQDARQQSRLRDVMSPNLVSCLPDDDLSVALVAMKEQGVRRLPVVDARGRLKGLLSIDDVILRTGAEKGRVPAEAVVDVLRHICSADDA